MTSAVLDRPKLVAPAYHHSPPTKVASDGGLVADLCDRVGFVPDLEQRLILDDVFGVNAEGLVAAYEQVIIAARQNLKTAALKMCVLGWVFIEDVPLTVWSSHELEYAREAMLELQTIIESSKMMRRRFAGAVMRNGGLALNFTGGQRVLFKARTTGGGRSLTADRLILDEAYAVRADHIGALIPTLSAVDDPQLVYGSSACLVNSDVLRALVKRGRSAGPADEPRFGFIEWANKRQGECQLGRSCPHYRGTPGCLADDPAEWPAANPALGRRIRLTTIQGERGALPPEQFVRERMGWHEGLDDESALAIEGWADSTSSRPIVGDRAVAVDITPRRDWASVGIAGLDARGRPRVELLARERSAAKARKIATRYANKHGLDFVYIIAGSQAQTLVPDIEAQGVEVHQLTNRELGAGCGWIFELTRDGKLGHPESVELNTAVEGVRLRDNGEGGWVWSRKQSATDISPLMAVTAAYWGHKTHGEPDYMPSAEDE